MIFNVSTKKDGFIEAIYDKSMEELQEFFNINWIENRPSIYVVQDRNTIDGLQQSKTEDWLVGWIKGKDVYILDRSNFDKESSNKYSEESYASIIKHELAHLFTTILSEQNNKPIWFWEGIAIYLSGQNKFKKKPQVFKDFLEYFDKGGKEVYSEPGFIIEILIKEFGKEKLLELIKSMKTVKTKEDFNSSFNKIYGFTPSYEEFNKQMK